MVKVIPEETLIIVVLYASLGIMVNDSIAQTKEDISCVENEARLLFSNPLERIMIQSYEVERGEDGESLVQVYLLGGLKYAEAEVTCHKGSRVLWRRWFGK